MVVACKFFENVDVSLGISSVNATVREADFTGCGGTNAVYSGDGFVSSGMIRHATQGMISMEHAENANF